MFPKKFKAAVSLALAATVLGGCGSSEPDSGSGTGGGGGGGDAVSGIVADGYIARAVVYFDQNDNNILDASERWALTDNDGHFSVGVDGTNYCASDATEEQENYCLTAPAFYEGSLLLRAVGGYDTSTSEPFYGALAREISDPSETIFASPIGSLLAYLVDADQATFASTEGISADELLSTNFLDFTETPNNKALISLAFIIQRTTDIIGHNVESTYESSFGGADQAIDAADLIHTAIATELHTTYIDNPSNISARQLRTVLSDAMAIARIIADVEAALGNSGATALPANMADRIAQMVSTIDVAFATDVSSNDDFNGRARAIEIAAKLMRKAAYNPSSAEAVSATSTLITDASYLAKLQDDAVDISDLASEIESGAITDASAIDYSAREPLPEVLVGQVLSIEDEDSSDRTDGENNAIAFKFLDNTGGTTAGDDEAPTEGKIELVVDYQSESDDESLTSTSDEPIEGTWTKLNEYSMLLNLEIGGSTQPVIMKRNADNTGYKFDFGGDIKEWTPKEGEDFLPI